MFFLKKSTHIFFIVIFSTAFCINSFPASCVSKGFKALSIYDYFLAKKTFYKINKKGIDPYASYGLAVIYSRHDNPFSNADSAAKYIHLSYTSYLNKRSPKKLSGFMVDSVSILSLCQSVAAANFIRIKNTVTIPQLDKYLHSHYLASADLKEQVIYLRDEMEYNLVISKNKSDSTLEFLRTHPQSAFYNEAALLRQRQIYDEETSTGSKEDYIRFISAHPFNPMLNAAYENLYKIYRDNSDVQGLKSFVLSYPKAPQNTEAWKLLFSLSVKSFSNEELEKFLLEYPAFPFRTSILKELELNKLVLYPYEKEDLFGFIDTTGKMIVKAEYESVTAFSEGLSVVSRNDSVFYVNKENEPVFREVYQDAHGFKNGIAAVKKNNQWAFINRQGQVISNTYDEINELSNNVYVVKVNNKYGALNHLGQIIIEPRFQKLGDFKNEFAYYTEEGKYGFISKSGYIYKADLEWISDFNEFNIAIIRKDGLFGLISSAGEIILEPLYDQISKAANNVFVVSKNSQYGFYSGQGCFVIGINYDYQKEKTADYYTNGHVFKLIRKSEQALVDANGKPQVDFGVYEEICFASNNLIRAKKKGKYGYLDRKLSTIIPFKYEKAGDFSDGLAIVKLKDKYGLINLQGKEIFSSEEPIEKLSSHYYVLGEDKSAVVDHEGKVLYDAIADLQEGGENLFILTLETGEIKFLRN